METPAPTVESSIQSTIHHTATETTVHPDTKNPTTMHPDTTNPTDTTDPYVRPVPPLVPSGIVTSSIIILSTPLYLSGEYYDNRLPGSSNRSVQCGEEIRLSVVHIINI